MQWLFVSRRVERLLTGVPVRALVAGALVAWHLVTMISFARDRFDGRPFDDTPSVAPYFRDPARETYADHGRRLIVTRWDGLHYLGLAIRGYSQCPHRRLERRDMMGPICDVAFYPGYPALGWLVHRVSGLAFDYALWVVSLAAALLATFLWTDRAIVGAVGVGAAYASLIVFNCFPTACYLVTNMTEPCMVAATLATFVALARRRYALGAVAAGFAGAVRLPGAVVEFGCCLAILSWMWLDRRGTLRRSAGRAALLPLACWGTGAVSLYHWWRFGDPMAYLHGHEAAFHHSGAHGLWLLFHPRPEWLIHAIDNAEHTAVWSGALFLFFLAGHRMALRRLPAPAQVFSYVIVFLTYLVCMAGTIDLWSMTGLTRYVLPLAPAFLAMGTLLSRRLVVLAAWCVLTVWNQREVDMCLYLGDVGDYGLHKCHLDQWAR